jgi:hypothetical protein
MPQANYAAARRDTRYTATRAPSSPIARGTGNGAVAPVCPTSRPQPVPGQPGPAIPAVPKATDLPSVIQAVNQLTQIINLMLAPPFTEVTRNVQTVRVYNPNDKSQWVDVERITNLTMANDLGQTWTWNYK